MKAAVMYKKDGMPQYIDFPDPTILNEDELLITMKAAALKHVDKSRATRKHYSTQGDISKAEVIGGDGVGVLEKFSGSLFQFFIGSIQLHISLLKQHKLVFNYNKSRFGYTLFIELPI